MEKTNYALLLLPSPPPSLTSSDIRSAFGAPIEGVFRHIARNRDYQLDVAVSVPTSWLESLVTSRTTLFDRAQEALAQTYSLIGVVAASHRIRPDCLDGVDTRIFYLLPTQAGSAECPISGPFVSLPTLIDSRSIYRTVYAVENEEGERLLKAYLSLHQSKYGLSPVYSTVPEGQPVANTLRPARQHRVSDQIHVSVAVGGTFDHLHIGHKLLLTSTALLAEPKGSEKNPSQTVFLTIGISGEALLTNKKYPEQMESWDVRQNKVAEFLESILVFSRLGGQTRTVDRLNEPGPNGKRVRVAYASSIVIDYVEISDPFGPTITDKSISALVLSQETTSGGEAVNEKRRDRGWLSLEVFEIDVLDLSPSDAGSRASPDTSLYQFKISSTEVRRRLHEEAHVSKEYG